MFSSQRGIFVTTLYDGESLYIYYKNRKQRPTDQFSWNCTLRIILEADAQERRAGTECWPISSVPQRSKSFTRSSRCCHQIYDANSWQRKFRNSQTTANGIETPYFTEAFGFITGSVSIGKAGTQHHKELYPRLSKDTVVKIILCLIKGLSPSEIDEQNSTLEDHHGTEQHCFENSLKKKREREGERAREIA